MKILREELKELVKERLYDIIEEENKNTISDIVYSIMDAQTSRHEKKARELYGVLFARLSALGFDREKLMKIKTHVATLTNEKDVEKFIAKYKLSDNDISERTLHTYKVIISIPFATTSNKDEKIKKLKYDLVTSGIKILGYKELNIYKIASAGTLGSVIDLQLLMKIKTYKKKNDLEELLQPNYGLEQIKQESSEIE
tara:strand:+ start:54 stop:647 length:594 start_codon:yes stop_codon:yes gene_type:complete